MTPLFTIFWRNLPPSMGPTLWDVGAHIGYHTLAFAALVGDSGHVVAFEPNPHNQERIRQHLEHNAMLAKRITLMTCTLSDADGAADFILSASIENSASSCRHLSTAFAQKQQQPTLRLRKMRVLLRRPIHSFEKSGIPPPSIIKLDVESAETLVLNGAKWLLATAKPVLLVEVHHIFAMYELTKLLLSLDSQIDLIHQAPNTPSRCFIVARPAAPTPRKAAPSTFVSPSG